MTNAPTLLVGLDFSDLSLEAYRQALELAAFRNAARLVAIHVAEHFGPMLRIDLPDGTTTVTQEEADSLFAEYAYQRAAELHAKPIEVTPLVRAGAPIEQIIAAAREFEADLIVVGTHGRKGLTRLLLGSVAEGVARSAGCPVLVVRPRGESEE